MKLLYKYSRINLLSSVLIFICAAVAFYFSLHFILLKQLDEELQEELTEITSYAASHQTLPEIIPSEDEVTAYQQTDQIQPAAYSSVSIQQADENEQFRQIAFSVSADSKIYRVSVSKSFEQVYKVIFSVLMVLLITFMLLLITGFIINRIILKKIWKPFYSSMALMKKFTPSQKKPFEFEQTDIDEFAFLNNTLDHAVKQYLQEYNKLKEFTENASHEMQTPVAVIRSKMDVLIQDEKLSESQSNLVHETYTAIQRLTKLNNVLLLLSKIGNNQFPLKENLMLDIFLSEKIRHFNELLQSKGLHVDYEHEKVVLDINPVLADVLVNNLLSNCIRHSKKTDSIKITLTSKKLVFANGPAEKPLDSRFIFDRFFKGSTAIEHHGLGLAVVKEIAVVSGLSVEYQFENDMHLFIVWL